MMLSLSHWYPGSGVVRDCIDSRSLPSFLLCLHYLGNELNFWNVHGIMNTSGLLQSK